jgi:hypothetical protein
MPLHDFQNPAPRTPLGAQLQAELVTRGKRATEFTSPEEAWNFVRSAKLNEEGTKAGLAPEDIQLQAQQLGIEGPLSGATVAPKISETNLDVPVSARGYADQWRKEQAYYNQRLAPAGSPGSRLVQMVADTLPSEQDMPLSEARVKAPVEAPVEAPSTGEAKAPSINEAGEYTPSVPKGSKSLGIEVDPMYQGVAGTDPRYPLFQRRVTELASQKQAELQKQLGTTMTTVKKANLLKRQAEGEAADEFGYEVRRNNLGETVGVNMTPLKPTTKQILGPEGDTYDVDVYADAQGRVIRASEPRHSKPGPATITQRGIDKTVGTEVMDYITNRRPDVEAKISGLEEARNMLEEQAKSSVGLASGSIVGAAADVPVLGRMFMRPNKNIKARIEQAGISGMRAALGAAFTAQENKDFLARNFDDYATEAENLVRLDSLLGALKATKVAKDAQAQWFLDNRTMKGYKGPVPASTADDIYAMRDENAAKKGIKPPGVEAKQEAATATPRSAVQAYIGR